MVDADWRVCTCCETWHQVELPGKPGMYRKKGMDGLYHDFVKYAPPLRKWKRRQIYCLICMTEHPMLVGPVSGKLYSQQCGS